MEKEEKKEKDLDIDFNTPQVLLLIGKPKKGKSNSIKYFILKNTIDKPVFKMGLVFSRTGGLAKEYDYIDKKFVHKGYDENILRAYIKELEKYVKTYGKPVMNFVVFDDLLGLLNKYDPFLMNFVSIHRHLGCSIFFGFQHLNMGTSTTMREICSYAVLYSSKSYNTLRNLFENFGTLYRNFTRFKKAFFSITEEQFTGMLYIQDEDNIENNYLKFKSPDMSQINYRIKFSR